MIKGIKGRPSTSVKSFITYGQLRKSFKFNNIMVTHHFLRDHPKDGSYRSKAEEDLNDLMGKIGEFATYNLFIQDGFECTLPSTKIGKRGNSDPGYDIILKKFYTTNYKNIQEATIDVKSSKWFAKSMILPYFKYKELPDGSVRYLDNQNNKNYRIPDLYIAVNVGTPNLHDYEKNFHPLINNICDENKNNDSIVPFNELNLYIKGVLDGVTVANSIRENTNLFFGKHSLNNMPAECIPTSKSDKALLDKDNYIFPYYNFNLKDLNPNNKNRKVRKMLEVYF